MNMYALHQMNSTHTHTHLKLAQGNNPLSFARASAVGSSLLHVVQDTLFKNKGQSKTDKAAGHLLTPTDETTTREGHMLAMTHPQNEMIKPTQ